MCARFGLYSSFNEFQKSISLANEIDFEASYNKAPSALSPIVIKNRVGLARWGLLPNWAEQSARAKPQHNARVETAANKAFFRDAWRSRRCLVPANGYYEWQTSAAGKQPFYFHFDEALFCFAGLWELNAEKAVTFTILTQPADDSVKNIHHRMPVILSPDSYDDWLVGGVNILPASRQYMRAMQISKVGKAVNNARNDEPSLIRPIVEGLNHSQ